MAACMVVFSCCLQILHAQTLTYDFTNGDILDWKETLGQALPSDNGGLAAQPKDDESHKSLILTSPAFTLIPGSAIRFQLAGGSSDASPSSLADILDDSTEGGFMGMGLRQVSDNSYVLTRSRPQNGNWKYFEFSAAELAELIKKSPDETYELDFIEAKHGRWGHIELKDVSISGKEVSPVNPPPAGFDKTDFSIYLRPEHGTLKYSIDNFSVKPNSKVKIILINTDEMQHNIIISKPGQDMNVKLGTLAIKMGDDGPKKNYIPDSPDVLFAMDIVEPGLKKALYFTAPSEEGEYPYVCTIPGHYLTMKGVMTVSKKARPDKKNAKPTKPSFPRPSITVNEVAVLQRADIYGEYRTHAGMGALLVGLPGDMNYAFNTERCALALAWTGGFINMQKEWSGRGGGGAAISGPVFFAMETQGGLASDKAKAEYKGYKLKDGQPIFLYSIGKADIEHSVSIDAEGPSIIQNFSVKNSSPELYFEAGHHARWTTQGLPPEEHYTYKLPAGKSVDFEIRSIP
jgi:uncharacterized cupredoxin-like copper-binding protein